MLLIGVYIYSNCIGCDGSRLLFDGGSLISVNGELVKQSEPFKLCEDDIDCIIAAVDINDIRQYQCRSPAVMRQVCCIAYRLAYSIIDEVMNGREQELKSA